MPFDLRGQILVRRLERVGFRRRPLAVRREQHVARVRDEEQHAREQRRPEQIPRDVRQNPLAPRTPSPFRRSMAALPPRMARFTRLRISGTL